MERRGVPRCCLGEIVAGVDEAGRGPILGPMVIAVVAAPARVFEELRLQGVRDSKELNPRARRVLAEEILRRACYAAVARIPPRLIDAVNLNKLEYDTIEVLAERLRGLCPGLRRLSVDAVGPPERLAERLRRLLGPGVVVAVEPRADRRRPEVAAASILAKVARDSDVEELRRRYGVRGSGYPTDPETLEWLREAYASSPTSPPDFVRRSWGTLKRIAPLWYLEKRRGSGQRSLLDYLGSGDRRH